MLLERIPYNSPSDILNIQARAPEHEAIIRRQGQSARILQLLKCPCNENGRVNLHCTICNGKGYTFKHQKKVIVIDENSPHYGLFETFPIGTPVIRGIAVRRCLHEVQGGVLEYTVTGNTDEKITFSGAYVPRRYEKLQVTYEYGLEVTVTNEDPIHTVAGYTLRTRGTKTDLRKISNPFNMHGDLTEVTRIYNVTTATSYNVLRFGKQTIIADDESGGKPAIQPTDVLQVDYKYVKPTKIGTGRVDLNNSLKKWSEEVKEGDMESMIPGGMYISKGDIITLLRPRLRETVVIKRGAGLTDELPQFDINEIIDDIIDEDGNKYVNDGTKFNLEEYNDLTWVSGQAPSAGKKYTVNYLYNPSYRIYKQDINAMTNEDKQFPNQVLLRYMNKFSKRDLKRF